MTLLTLARGLHVLLTACAIALAGLTIPSSARIAHADGLFHRTRDWQRYVVPGATCGDGSPYNVLVSPGNPRKIAFDIMGGGACWNAETCYGPTPLAWTHAIPGVFERSGFVSLDPDKSPVSDYTIVYFPYCTGDVHLGTHVAEYDLGLKVRHVGRTDFELSLQYLVSSKLVALDQAESFVLFGYSAGAIGALYHVFAVAPLLPPSADKVLIADSPGLHFGPRFWDKFPDAWLADVQSAMDRVHYRIERGHGNVAAIVPALCRRLPDWRVAVLQGTRDIIMSLLFGDISQADHEALVLGPDGIGALTADPTDNCSAWLPRSAMHTFLVTDATAAISVGGESAMDFARDAVLGVGGPNYRPE